MVSTSLSRTQRAANVPPTLARNTSAVFWSLSISRSNLMRGLFEKFSLNLMVVSTRSESLPMLAPGNDFVFLLVVNLLIRSRPGCRPTQLLGVESAGKGESMALCKL